MANAESEQEKRLKAQRDHFRSMEPTSFVDVKKGSSLPGLAEDGKAKLAEQDTQVLAHQIAKGLDDELTALQKRIKERREGTTSTREQTSGSALVGGTVSTIPTLTSALA